MSEAQGNISHTDFFTESTYENRKFLLVLSFMDKLEQCTLEAYEEVKYTLLATIGSKNPDLLDLIKEMCRIVEVNRPQLIEMK